MAHSPLNACYSIADLFSLAQGCDDAIKAGKAAEKLADEAYAAIADRRDSMSLGVVYEFTHNYARHGAVIREDGTPVMIGKIGYHSEILAYMDGSTKMVKVVSSHGILAKETVDTDATEPPEESLMPATVSVPDREEALDIGF